MKKIILYAGIMLSLATCLFYFYYKAGRFSNTYAELEEKMEHQGERIQRLDSGVWYASDTNDYIDAIYFESNNSVNIHQYIQDTMMWYKYKLNKDTLWLFFNENLKAQRVSNKIKSHRNTELIFETFLHTKKEMTYLRIKTFP